MTKLQKAALVLFKDYTLLRIKQFRDKTTNAAELEIIDAAIELHHVYNETNITNKTKTKR